VPHIGTSSNYVYTYSQSVFYIVSTHSYMGNSGILYLTVTCYSNAWSLSVSLYIHQGLIDFLIQLF